VTTTYPPRLQAMIGQIRAAIECDDYLRRSYHKELLIYAGRHTDEVTADLEKMVESLMVQARERFSGPELAYVEQVYLARSLMIFDDVTAMAVSGGAA